MPDPHNRHATPSTNTPPLIVDTEGNTYIPRILVAFEAPDIVRLLDQSLRQVGYQVMTAGDGRKALEKVRSEMPDLVVMDTALPFLDGFQVVECMKSVPNTAEIPVVFIHTLGPVEDPLVFRYFQSGADCFLTAPFNPLEVVTNLRRIFDSLRPRPPRSNPDPE